MTAKLCKARRSDGEPCKRPPIRGGRVCASHGGRAPAVRAAADRRLAEQEATREVARLTDARGPLTLPDVYREMLTTAGDAVAWQSILRERVGSLDDYSSTAMGAEQVRADVVLFERAMDRTAKVLELVARLDLDARISNIVQRDVEILVGIVKRARDSVGLTPEQSAAFDAAMAEELRKVGEAGEWR